VIAVIIGLWKFAGSGIGKAVLAALAVVLLALAFIWWLHSHDAAIVKATKESMLDAEAKAVAVQQAADNVALEAAQSDLLTAQQARAASLSTIRTAINVAPSSSVCAASPAVSAALAGLRRPDAAHGSGRPAGAPGKPVPVQPAAEPARRTFR
jgi:hypothetical protein